jgi:hypothetical protein
MIQKNGKIWQHSSALGKCWKCYTTLNGNMEILLQSQTDSRERDQCWNF